MDNPIPDERHDEGEVVSGLPSSGTELPDVPVAAGPTDSVESEAEILRRELALFQAELDAIQDRVGAIQRESSSLAATLRRQGEEQARAIVAKAEEEAQQIIQRAVAKADLVELRAKVRAEETRAKAVARLWSRMEASRASIVGGRRFTAGENEDQLLADLLKLELKETGDSADSDSDPHAGESAKAMSSAGDEAEESTDAAPVDTEHPPTERRYHIADRLSFASMMALEGSIRSLPGVIAAAMTPLSGGGTLLSVISTDPESVARRLAETTGLPAFQETT